MDKYPSSLVERTSTFGVSTIRLTRLLPKNPAGFTIADQLVRAGTSVGAQLVEAQEAHTDKEFLYKLVIALKEAKETKYWLYLISESQLINKKEIMIIQNEIEELIRILVASVKKLKAKRI